MLAVVASAPVVALGAAIADPLMTHGFDRRRRAEGSLRVSYYNSQVEIHPSARKHGISDDDIEHAVTHAMTIDDQDDDTRLYLGPSRGADLLEVVTIVREDGTELVIHAMRMRPKYRHLLPEV